MEKKKIRLLFQGDSITDMGRDREDIHNLGFGYPKFTAERLVNLHPEIDFEFLNQGISGDRAESLKARWQTDCIDLQPDVVSILIGINDTWHHVADQSWMPHSYFEECYRFCLEEIRNKTNARIIMIEQFLLPGNEFTEQFRPDMDPKVQVTRKLAREYADVFIPMDGIFAAHCIGVDGTAWAGDCVHPSEAGARLIADAYADAFEKILPLIQ